jgi:hypothetical protein
VESQREDRIRERKRAETFWLNQAGWPDDSNEHIFLGRALDLIGKARLGEKWTGQEFQTLYRHRLHFAPSSSEGYDDAVSRRGAVTTETVRQFQAENLDSFAREFSGGQMRPIPPSWWNTEASKIEGRFIKCQINMKQPFSALSHGAGDSWIYMLKESLRHHLDTLQFAAAPFQVDRGSLLYATMEMLVKIYGWGDLPGGVTLKDALRHVNQRLKEERGVETSPITLRRAVQEVKKIGGELRKTGRLLEFDPYMTPHVYWAAGGIPA